MILYLRKRLITKGTTKTLLMQLNLPSTPPIPFKILLRKPMVQLLLIHDVLFDPQTNNFISDLGCESVNEIDFEKRIQFYLDQGWKTVIELWVNSATKDGITWFINGIEGEYPTEAEAKAALEKRKNDPNNGPVFL